MVDQNGGTADVLPRWVHLVQRMGWQVVLLILFGFGLVGVLILMTSIWDGDPVLDGTLGVLIYSQRPLVATLVVVFTVIGSMILAAYLVLGSLSAVIDRQSAEAHRLRNLIYTQGIDPDTGKRIT